jgi:hypothetical protein
MKYAVEIVAMDAGGRMYIPSNANVLPQKSEILQCWYDSWDGFMKYDFEMGPDAKIYIPSLINIGPVVQNLSGTRTHARTHTGTSR